MLAVKDKDIPKVVKSPLKVVKSIPGRFCLIVSYMLNYIIR